MTASRYQEVKAPEIPHITDDDGTQVRVVCGNFWGKRGPFEGIPRPRRGLPGKKLASPTTGADQAW